MSTIDIDKIEPDGKYIIKDNTFFATPKDNIKDLIEVEIGDSKVPDKFLPQMKICRWGNKDGTNECNFSVRLKHKEDAPKVSKDGEKVKWEGSKMSADIYALEEGHEFEVILHEKPETNIIEFSLETKDLEFFYQPELEDSEVQEMVEREGISLLEAKRKCRPENVIGSYAVYTKENKVNYTGGKEYKCGKVGHIYRPRIEDASGNKVWGELNIDKNVLTVTIPQEFLDNAVYPIKHAAGLEIGYTTQGASGGLTIADEDRGSEYSKRIGTKYAGADGNVTKITASLSADDNVANGTAFINEVNSEGADSHGEIAQSTELSNIPIAKDWRDFTCANEVISSGVYYVLNVCADPTAFEYYSEDRVLVYYDSVDAGQGYYYFSGGDSYANQIVEDPWTQYSGGSNIKVSIYATYTAAGSGTNTQINIGDSWKEISAMKINIGDSWKDVVAVKQNIGDVWKDVF